MLSSPPINRYNQLALSTHPLNPPYQPTLSTHPLNPPYQPTQLSPLPGPIPDAPQTSDLH